MNTASPQYRRVFERTAERLEAKSVSVSLEFGPTVTAADLDHCANVWEIIIPPSLRQFYFEVGNGLTFNWFLDRSCSTKPFEVLSKVVDGGNEKGGVPLVNR